jgi:hypothetical protein
VTWKRWERDFLAVAWHAIWREAGRPHVAPARTPRRSVPLFFSFLEALVPLMVLAGPRRGPCQCHDSHALAPPVGELAMAYATSLCELSTLARVTGSRCSRSPIPSGTDSWTVQEESSHGDEHVQALADDDGRISHSRRLIW